MAAIGVGVAAVVVVRSIAYQMLQNNVEQHLGERREVSLSPSPAS